MASPSHSSLSRSFRSPSNGSPSNKGDGGGGDDVPRDTQPALVFNFQYTGERSGLFAAGAVLFSVDFGTGVVTIHKEAQWMRAVTLPVMHGSTIVNYGDFHPTTWHDYWHTRTDTLAAMQQLGALNTSNEQALYEQVLAFQRAAYLRFGNQLILLSNSTASNAVLAAIEARENLPPEKSLCYHPAIVKRKKHTVTQWRFNTPVDMASLWHALLLLLGEKSASGMFAAVRSCFPESPRTGIPLDNARSIVYAYASYCWMLRFNATPPHDKRMLVYETMAPDCVAHGAVYSPTDSDADASSSGSSEMPSPIEEPVSEPVQQQEPASEPQQEREEEEESGETRLHWYNDNKSAILCVTAAQRFGAAEGYLAFTLSLEYDASSAGITKQTTDVIVLLSRIGQLFSIDRYAVWLMDYVKTMQKKNITSLRILGNRRLTNHDAIEEKGCLDLRLASLP